MIQQIQNIKKIKKLHFLFLAVIMLFAHQALAQEADIAPPIIARAMQTQILQDQEAQAFDLQIVELPGAPSNLSTDGVVLKAYMRSVAYEDQLIGQIVVTGVEKNGVFIALTQDDFSSQLNLEDNEIAPNEPLSITGNNAELVAALLQFNDAPEALIENDETGEALSASAGGDGGGNEDAASYQSPAALDIEEEADPVISIANTTDGCDVKIDIAQGVAIQQSKSITYTDGAITSESECSDTLDRFALVKSYSVCSDLVDMEALSATAQFVYYYVDAGGARNDVTDCALDDEYIFPIVEKTAGCTVSLDFSTDQAVPQSSLIYYNRNAVETQVQTCEPSASLTAVDLIESADGCSIRHDFADDQSVQFTSWTYLMDGLNYQALPCSDSDISYPHELAYANDVGEYICTPIVNMDSQKVTLQSKTRILVNGVYQYISECEPDDTTLNVLATIDGCTDMSKWTHDVTANLSYAQHRYYYVKSDNSREYVTACLDSEVSYPHQLAINGYQNHDDLLSSYQLVTIWIDGNDGRFTILNSAVKEGSQLIPYALSEVKDQRNGLSEYADNSCDALRLQDKVEVWQRPDLTNYNKIIGEGVAVSQNACTAVFKEPVWEYIEGSTIYGTIYKSSLLKCSYASTDKDGGRISRTTYYLYYYMQVSQRYKGHRILMRDDGNFVTQNTTTENLMSYAPNAKENKYNTARVSYYCSGPGVRTWFIDMNKVRNEHPDPPKAPIITNAGWSQAEGWYPGTVQIVKK